MRKFLVIVAFFQSTSACLAAPSTISSQPSSPEVSVNDPSPSTPPTTNKPTNTSFPATPTPIPPTQVPRLDWKYRGGSAGVPSWDLREYSPSRSDIIEAIERMKSNGLNAYQLSTPWFMPNGNSVEIGPIFSETDLHPGLPNNVLPTVSDYRISALINILHQQDLKVFLRPDIEVNDGRTWRGEISPSDWNDWFQGYEHFIIHYAEIAEDNNVELLSIGFELNSSVHHVEEWNDLIAEVRSVYSGEIVYGAGGLLYHGLESAYTTQKFGPSWQPPVIGEFLHETDYVGVDWYPQIAADREASTEQIQQNVQAIVDHFLQPVAQEFDKPVIFSEIDYSSIDKTTIDPLTYRSGGPIDVTEQARAYDAVFQALHDESWFSGMFPAGFYLTVFRDSAGTTNSIWYKPAEEVFRYWYGAE